MDATVVVAAMGFTATLLAAWLSARLQRQGDREGRILDARVRTYGECSDSLYEYARATYNRVRARLESQPDDYREELRQEAYRCNARARSAIGQTVILTRNESLQERLAAARHAISEMNDATDYGDLRRRQQDVYETLKDALNIARADLMARR
jgi:hypothetical protein